MFYVIKTDHRSTDRQTARLTENARKKQHLVKYMPGLNSEIQIHHDKHHKVSSLVKSD